MSTKEISGIRKREAESHHPLGLAIAARHRPSAAAIDRVVLGAALEADHRHSLTFELAEPGDH